MVHGIFLDLARTHKLLDRLAFDPAQYPEIRNLECRQRIHCDEPDQVRYIAHQIPKHRQIGCVLHVRYWEQCFAHRGPDGLMQLREGRH